MVVLVLVLIWLVVVLPIAVRKLSEFQLVSSVARFHHQTELLGRVHENFVGSARGSDGRRAGAPPLDDAQLAAVRAVQTRIDERRSRRREALLLLGSGILSTLLIGAVPSLRAFWVVAVLLATVTGVYLAMLVRCATAEALAAERARKIVVMPVTADEAGAELERRVFATGNGGLAVVPESVEPARPRPVAPGRPA